MDHAIAALEKALEFNALNLRNKGQEIDNAAQQIVRLQSERATIVSAIAFLKEVK